MKSNINRRLVWIGLLAATPLGLSITCGPGGGGLGLFRGNDGFFDSDSDSDAVEDFFDDLEDAFDD